MSDPELPRLRVLVAGERPDELEALTRLVARLGHDVVSEADPGADIGDPEAAATSAREHPDVAVVAVGVSSPRALELIERLASQSACPVIAVLATEDPAYVSEAARRGAFAYVAGITPEKLQSAIDIAMHRFGEFHNLQGALGRRAVIEQAKGILMARHAIGAAAAFEMLRDHSQHGGHKLADVATALVDSHRLYTLPLPLNEPAD